MSAAPSLRPALAAAPVVRSVPAPAAAGTAPALVRRGGAAMLVQRFAARVSHDWAPLVAWHIGRTGRPGLVGLVLIVASSCFLVSTHLKVANEAATLRVELATAQQRAASAPHTLASVATQALRNLPRRADMPAVLGVLLKQADDARLTLDTGKYEMSSTKTGDITRYKLSFPVVGPYPQVRQFVDSILTALPAAAVSELSFERKSVGDGAVEAQIRLTVFTRSAP